MARIQTQIILINVIRAYPVEMSRHVGMQREGMRMVWWLLAGLSGIVVYMINVLLLLGQLREQALRQRHLPDRILRLLERLGDDHGPPHGGSGGRIADQGVKTGEIRCIY
jgi:hypothetical protein